MATAVFLGFLAFSLYLAIRSKKGRGPQSVHDFFVASRQFGAYLVFFLAAGEIYSIGTMVGFPGGIYAKGPTFCWPIPSAISSVRRSGKPASAITRSPCPICSKDIFRAARSN
jgi:Na+/proline symporter